MSSVSATKGAGRRDLMSWLTEALLLLSQDPSSAIEAAAHDDDALPALIAQVQPEHSRFRPRAQRATEFPPVVLFFCFLVSV